MPILDLRIRKGVRRNHVQLAVATSRPSSLDPNAAAVARFAPGRRRGVPRRAERRAGRRRRRRPSWPRRPARPSRRCATSRRCSTAQDVVILYGERLLSGPRADHAAPRAAQRRGEGLRPRPRRRRPAGDPRRRRTAAACARSAASAERAPAGIADGRGRGRPDRAVPAAHRPAAPSCPATGSRALDRATTVIAHAMFLTPGIAEHATSSSRPSPRPSATARVDAPRRPPAAPARRRSAARATCARAGRCSTELGKRLGADTGILTGPMATAAHGRARPVLRRRHARRARRARRALAGARRRRGVPRRRRLRAVRARDAAAARRRATARSCARHVPLDLGRARGGGTRPRCSSCARARACCCRPPTRSASSSFDGMTRDASRPTAREAVEATVARARRRAGGHGVPRGRHRRRDRHRGHPQGRRRAVPHDAAILATVDYYEPWYVQIIKAIVLFAVGLQLVPLVLVAERKILGRFQHRYGPNRVGPFGIAAAAGRHPQAASRRSSSARRRRSAGCSRWRRSSRS